MNHIADIGLINPHSKCVRCHHHRLPVVNKVLLILFPLTISQSGVIFCYRHAGFQQHLIYGFYIFSGSAINYAAVAGMLRYIMQYISILLFGSFHREIKILPVESGDCYPWIR